MTSDSEHDGEEDIKVDTEQSVKTSSPVGKDTVPKRRTKTGCLTCRKRRIKCGEERPVCKNCIKSKRDCAGYYHPLIYKQQGNHQPYSVTNPVATPQYDWVIGQNSSANLANGYSDLPQSVSESLHLTTSNAYHSAAPVWSISAGYNTLQYQAPTPAISRNDRQSQSQDFQWSHIPHDDLNPITPTFHRDTTLSNAHPSDGTDAQHVTYPITPINHDILQRNELLGTGVPETQYSNHGFVQRPSLMNALQPQWQTLSNGDDRQRSSEADEDSDDPWDVDLENGEHNEDLTFEQKVLIVNETNPYAEKVEKTATDDIKHQALVLRPEPAMNSPLLDPRSRKILEHFTSVTGPCMGIFEEYKFSSSGAHPRMTWNHGLSAMAFWCPALAHAMLAVGAMHMSKLNLSSENLAVKHFMYALRRVGNLLGNPRQRHQVSTLATILILGYYEVMAGDHSRWNLHLSGAVKLLMEHDYAGMTRTVRNVQHRGGTHILEKIVSEQTTLSQDRARMAEAISSLSDDSEWKVDQNFVSRLTGYEVKYDTQSQPNFPAGGATVLDLDQKGLENWRILMDLFWWCAKQVVFMSMLSGDPLLLPYPRWKYCPPRGPIGMADMSNATFDHLWLLIARLTDFGGKDRKRKQRVVNAQGGQWMPAPGFLGRPQVPSLDPRNTAESPNRMSSAQRRPSANESRTRKAKQPSSATGPGFYGMIPPATGPIQMPASFRTMNEELRGTQKSSPTDAESPHEQDLDAQIRRALEEHTAISDAFDVFESALGPDFHFLPASDIQITTPFGPALQYRSPTIAAIWTFFLVGRILLRRMHPHSPPAAMVSAGVNAHMTHDYAQKIGRICGGLFAQHTYLLQTGHSDHTLTAAITETTFSLLFAAVQYQDPGQRGWTISKLSEVAQVAGWQTAAAVAAACESAWEAASLAGKGPPYQRTMDQNNSDVRMSGRHKYQYMSHNAKVDMSPVEEHESRFVSHDRNLIDKHASTRAHWALGLLSVDEDLEKITLTDES